MTLTCLRAAAAALALAPVLAGCLGAAPPPVVVATIPAGPPPVSGWLSGPSAPALDEADRERAFAAEITAIETGRRASWRSPRGHFGVVEPSAQMTGPCRAYTHAVYLDGKAQRGGGTGCPGATGLWEIKA